MPSEHNELSSNGPNRGADITEAGDSSMNASEFSDALVQGQKTVDSYSEIGGGTVSIHSLSSHYEGQQIEFPMNVGAFGQYLVELGAELEDNHDKIHREYLSPEQKTLTSPDEIEDLGSVFVRTGFAISANSESIEEALPRHRIEPSYVKATVKDGALTDVEIDWRVLVSTLRWYHDVIERVRPDINEGLDDQAEPTMTPNPLQNLASTIEAQLDSELGDKFYPDKALQEVPVYWPR
ncbi:hypothetical protein SPB21_07215 [Leptothoe sp. ISB3NOV94-8A]